MFTYPTVSVLTVNLGDSISASNLVGLIHEVNSSAIKDSLGRVRLHGSLV